MPKSAHREVLRVAFQIPVTAWADSSQVRAVRSELDEWKRYAERLTSALYAADTALALRLAEWAVTEEPTSPREGRKP